MVFPGADDVQCNGVDEDGSGADDCPADRDGDGVRADRDCDDGDPARSPVARDEFCNGIDENCDGADDCDADGNGIRDADEEDVERIRSLAEARERGGPRAGETTY